MPVIDLENYVGVVEMDGRVVCAECIEKTENYWKRNWDEGVDILTEADIENGSKVYICDICNHEI